MTNFDRLAESKNSVANMEREIEKLRAALKPFADANLDKVTLNDDRTASALGVTLGDFRNAHDILYPPKVG